MSAERGTVVAVGRSDAHTFTKPNQEAIVLVAGIGVEGDTHSGVNVRHRSRVAVDPSQPNLRQVHLIHAELFEEVADKGYQVPAGGLGENVTTAGVDLLGLPRGTILRFGPQPTSRPTTNGTGESGPEAGGPVAAVLAAAAAATLDDATARAAAAVAAAAERDTAMGGGDPRPAVIVAGLRNPCAQINRFRAGLLKEVVGRDAEGNPVRKAGVMGVVLRGGAIRPGDAVTVELPPGPHGPLERV